MSICPGCNADHEHCVCDEIAADALPNMVYEEAEKLWEETDYAWEAAEQDTNPINGADATAFFLEGYLYARKRLFAFAARNAREQHALAGAARPQSMHTKSRARRNPMDAETIKATLAEKEAHTELMKAHAELMRQQARLTKAQAVSVETDNTARK